VSHARTKLERRARALLRAYPEQYRRDRAEEIITTLLEAAPADRSCPSARDTWSLLAGGRHARAVRNRALGAKANFRLALLLGLSSYVSTQIGFGGGGWLAAGDVALLAAALAPWLGSRTATTVLAILAGGLVAYPRLALEPPGSHVIMSYLVVLLIALGALAALSGGPARLPRSWSWLPWALPAVTAVEARWSFLVPASDGYANVLLLLAVVVVCWLVTDARPAFGFGVALLLTDLCTSLSQLDFAVRTTGSLVQGTGALVTFLVLLAIISPILLPAAWLLRRKPVPSPQPFPHRNG
jgi:hypothetical protein